MYLRLLKKLAPPNFRDRFVSDQACPVGGKIGDTRIVVADACGPKMKIGRAAK
ncbi:hypothetical protein [Sphingomonas taxi]|uniref:hypothetical protein n=1 Tax=Sphingomonas taxi TaxID=1549858 RepID=UPI0012E06648|nr:hypothetical protein [Sphingomonas taxi]